MPYNFNENPELLHGESEAQIRNKVKKKLTVGTRYKIRDNQAIKIFTFVKIYPHYALFRSERGFTRCFKYQELQALGFREDTLV